MSALPEGIVLPSDILVQPWFGIFGLFVALNTIVYLGLTAAKMIPWPAPVHPSSVRHILNPHAEEPSMPNIYRSAFRELDNPAQGLRDTAARQTIPMALALVGGLTATVALLYILLYYDTSGPVLLFGPIYGFILIVASLILARTRASAASMRWTWTLLMLFLVAENSWRADLIDSAVPLAYALVCVGFLSPITLSWPFGACGAIIAVIPVTIGGYFVSVVDTFSWGLASVTAAIASLVLLYLRLTALDRIAEERARAEMLATTDVRTGTFSRTGLIALAPSVAAAAERADEDVSVAVCRIPGLSRINANYGFDYGGEVLLATARSLRASLPERAILARWSGDMFLAVMSGDVPAPDTLEEAVDQRLKDAGIALGKTPITVRVGTATGPANATTLEELVAQAETHALVADG